MALRGGRRHHRTQPDFDGRDQRQVDGMERGDVAGLELQPSEPNNGPGHIAAITWDNATFGVELAVSPSFSGSKRPSRFCPKK